MTLLPNTGKCRSAVAENSEILVPAVRYSCKAVGFGHAQVHQGAYAFAGMLKV
jgi:hypothetical protein